MPEWHIVPNVLFHKVNITMKDLLEKKATEQSRDHLTAVQLIINGRQYELQLEPWTSLLDALREHLNMTGTKKGCDHGQCGACTVLVDGKRINSCLTFAVMYQGNSITTIEGFAQGDHLHPMQQAFIDHDAFQCGYCTPGQICSAIALLQEGKAKSAEDVKELMSGNLCRCAAYNNIHDAIETVMLKQNEKLNS